MREHWDLREQMPGVCRGSGIPMEPPSVSYKHHLGGWVHALHLHFFASSPLPNPGSSSLHLTEIFPAASPTDPG